MNKPSFLPFKKRRDRLLEHIGEGLAIIPTAPEKIRNKDTHHPYRFDSYFWYLTGFPEPEAVLILTKGRSILFCREKDDKREIWEGFSHGPKNALKTFGTDEAYPILALHQMLPQLLSETRVLWHSFNLQPDWDSRIVKALKQAQGTPPDTLRDWRPVLDEMRLIKDVHELSTLRKAADIAAQGHLRAMQACRAGMMEYGLEAELSYEFRRRGASGHAYPPIVASGKNACTLHYSENNAPLQNGDLVLIDAGCELDGYAADISRTFPVNGRFSPAQKDCYEIVLAAQAAALSKMRPGAGFNEPHEAAVRTLTQGMIDLGLLTGSLDSLIETESYTRFYMHRTGHWLGLDVHDVGTVKTGENWRALTPGMVLTVEPGLYIRPHKDIPPALSGIGLRIEDNVIITPEGGQVYTHAPKTITEIEEAMQNQIGEES